MRAKSARSYTDLDADLDRENALAREPFEDYRRTIKKAWDRRRGRTGGWKAGSPPLRAVKNWWEAGVDSDFAAEIVVEREETIPDLRDVVLKLWAERPPPKQLSILDLPAEPKQPVSEPKSRQRAGPRADAGPYVAALEAELSRGLGPVTLCTKDLKIAEKLEQGGVPADLVCEVIRTARGRRASEGRKLFFTLHRHQWEIARKWRGLRKLLAPGSSPPAESPCPSVLLELLADQLPAGKEKWKKRILDLGELVDFDAIDEALTQVRFELIAEVWSALSEKDREEIDTRLKLAREKLRPHHSTSELEKRLANLRDQIVEEKARLPILSLHAAEELVS